MTDQSNDDDLELGRQLAAQAELYEAALDSPVTATAVDFLARAHLLTDITGDDLEAAREAIHTEAGKVAAKREHDALSDEERAKLTNAVAQHWSLNVNLAVRRMWHAATVLGFQPDTLDPKHIAMVAAMYLSRPPREVYDELAGVVAKSDS